MSGFAILLLAGPIAAPAPPQPKPDDSVPITAVRLLEHRKIQKELKMTAEQRIGLVDGLADIEDAYEARIGALVNNPNTTDKEFEKLDRDREKAVVKLLADAAASSLTPAQRTRLRQLDRRLRGAAAFTDPQVEKALLLTDAQKKTAAAVAERLRAEVDRHINGEVDGDDDRRKAGLLAFRKDRLKEMEAVLTKDQKAAWAALLGAAPTLFDADEMWLRVTADPDLTTPPGLGK